MSAITISYIRLLYKQYFYQLSSLQKLTKNDADVNHHSALSDPEKICAQHAVSISQLSE